MNDNDKSCLAIFLFASALIFPIFSFLIGWIGWDLKIGAWAALITLGVLAIPAAILFLTVRDPSAWVSSLPILMGMLYTILPDAVLGGFDDSAVFTLGALLSFLLWRRKDANLPSWLLIPIAISAVYTFIGGFIPGPFDEILVYLVSAAATWAKLSQSRSTQFNQQSNIVEGEWRDVSQSK